MHTHENSDPIAVFRFSIDQDLGQEWSTVGQWPLTKPSKLENNIQIGLVNGWSTVGRWHWAMAWSTKRSLEKLSLPEKKQNYLNEAIKQAQISKILYVIAQQRSDQSITMLTVFWV